MSMTESDDFICVHCGMPVSGLAWGTKHRNHCPHCLHSRHVDMRPGDRACLCKGEMQPIALWQKADGELMILHRCQTCGMIKANRAAGDDNLLALQALLPRIVG
ncbi:RNHCP domain-containing protein [Sphaerochaeta globosa]|uniref:RNHCP domain-containing protein n=1 Tax=Sphaerochaeta globosa (strain ATCC BAA-1886 / DSM 22777 / Buddy) TaxID=158189 RepID=F0RV87_SPHGB|nr:RNHCP domain-containing protein [Sphaerochaeta globosa]ADY12809.1 hypothetical protein SpiBuddy_0982 [Sphaerochaeta globosa str. Buddy]